MFLRKEFFESRERSLVSSCVVMAFCLMGYSSKSLAQDDVLDNGEVFYLHLEGMEDKKAPLQLHKESTSLSELERFLETLDVSSDDVYVLDGKELQQAGASEVFFLISMMSVACNFGALLLRPPTYKGAIAICLSTAVAMGTMTTIFTAALYKMLGL